MTTKEFDTVRNVRRIRDELSEQFATMSYEEQRRFLDESRRANAPIQPAQPGRKKSAHRQPAPDGKS